MRVGIIERVSPPPLTRTIGVLVVIVILVVAVEFFLFSKPSFLKMV